MAIDEELLKKIGEDHWDIAPLVNLEWRYRATAEGDVVSDFVRNRPLLSRSYSIERGAYRTAWRLHGEGHTNKEGVAEVYLTDFLRADDGSMFEPAGVVFVATAQADEPVVITHTVESSEVDINSPVEISTLYTATIRAWSLDGSPKAVGFSWQAVVDTDVDAAVIGG